MITPHYPVIFKYDEFGDLLWADTSIKLSSSNADILFERVFADAHNNIYVLGIVKGTISFARDTINYQFSNALVLFKYDKNGKGL